MGALLFTAILLSFVTGMWSITYNLDYVANVYNGYIKAVPEIAALAYYEDGAIHVGFDESVFTSETNNYFKTHLEEKYSGKYGISLSYRDHESYAGGSSYPTACDLTFFCDINSLITYSESATFYIRSNNG